MLSPLAARTMTDSMLVASSMPDCVKRHCMAETAESISSEKCLQKYCSAQQMRTVPTSLDCRQFGGRHVAHEAAATDAAISRSRASLTRTVHIGQLAVASHSVQHFHCLFSHGRSRCHCQGFRLQTYVAGVNDFKHTHCHPEGKQSVEPFESAQKTPGFGLVPVSSFFAEISPKDCVVVLEDGRNACSTYAPASPTKRLQ